MSSRQEKIDSLRRYTDLIRKQTGRVVRPYRPFRQDGYVNMLNKYGTSRDTSERYEYRAEPPVPDDMLTMFYEGNGLFARIIDSPAEEALNHGFTLKGLSDEKIEDFYTQALAELDWEETAMLCVKWARLFGGSIAVMMINDGRGIDEPLDWREIRSIDDIRVYDRSLIQPDYSSMFSYDPDDPFGTRGSRLGMPEYYDVFSKYGSFRVHDSRCLVFQNGVLPENTSNSAYQLWGIPEYIRLKRAIRDAEVAHGTAPKMLDRSVQAIYRMKDLAAELATEEGEDRVLRRLQTIDMARGLLNSITIDSEGEDYDFRAFSFTGVSEVIDSTCNYLSALTCIPQTILFGRSPAGMNSTGMSDLENWYNYLGRIQNRMIKKNLRYLLSIIFQAGVTSGEIDEVPPIKVEFNPLWSLSEQEEASLEQMRAATKNTNANTAMVYVQMQAVDPSEVRKKLADSEEFDVETLLDEYDEEELLENDPMQKQQQQQGGMPGMPPMGGAEGGGVPPAGAPEGGGEGALMGGAPQAPQPQEGGVAPSGAEQDKDIGGNAPAAAPAATKLPQDMSPKEKGKAAEEEKKRVEEEQKAEAEEEKHNDQDPDTKDTLRNAWLGVGPVKQEDEGPEDTLRNAWLGNTPVQTVEVKDPEDTLRNAWLGTSPEDKGEKKKAGVLPKAVRRDPLPGDTLRNAWPGTTSEVQEPKEPEDTLRNAWPGKTPASEEAQPEDTLRNAWEGVLQNPPKSPGKRAKCIKDKYIRLFRTASTDGGNLKDTDALKDRESKADSKSKGAVGVYVVKDGKILAGTRASGDGEGMLCGPGGHIEDGETPGQAAIRETQEEFGITPMELIPVGMGLKGGNGLQPHLFLCTRYEGKPKCVDEEMHYPRFVAMEELENSDNLFPAFEDGYKAVVRAVSEANRANGESIDLDF